MSLGTVCFHALILHSRPFPKTHDLPELLVLVPEGVELGINVREAAALTRFSVEARYLGEWEPIARAEAEEAVRTAGRFREAIRRHLPAETFPAT